MKWTIMLPLLLLSGCLNITTQLQPIYPAVKASLIGKDCTPIFAGLAYGENTVELAMRRGRTGKEQAGYSAIPFIPITKIRSLALTDMNVLIFGERCIEVTGE